MQAENFKNQPDQGTSLLFLVPGFLLSIFYLLTIHSGEITGYFLAALVGVIGYVMGFWKRLRPLRIWQSLALGFGIGAGSFLVATISSPLWNLGHPALLAQPGPLVGAVVTIALVVLSFQLLRRSGILALLAVIVALGTLNAVNLTIADVAEGKSHYGQIALLLAYSVPLVVCPAWLLLARTWSSKKYGVLLSWIVMILSIVIVLPVADRFLEPHFFRYPWRLVDMLGGVVEHVPLLIGLWLAFTLHERTDFFPAQ